MSVSRWPTPAPSETARTRPARRYGSTSAGWSPPSGGGSSTADVPDRGRVVLRAAAILGLVAVLTACSPPVNRVLERPPGPAITTSTPATRLSKTPPPPLSTTSQSTSGAGETQVVPDPASHKACRILNWSDLPADVRPADPSPHVTYANDPEQCRIDNSVFEINPGPEGVPDTLYFVVRTLVSHDLSPIEQYAKATAETTGRMITIGGQPAVERVWTDGSLCAVYLEPEPEPFGVAIHNTRFPQYDQCKLARSLAEAILRRYR